ncbi:MAG: CoB--CoM heterodisulfide reductase iron-sulfur subunit A family protein [Deltaproteobacteria bacterium]|nr:CoB--CoM heterodisulfide reductase iron-sulfur subunit A family protein [Deltaproteobacteria bacterium]
MAGKKILLCNCPDLKVDLNTVAAELSGQPAEVMILEPCCTPAGLARLEKILQETPDQCILAACGPELSARFFKLLTGFKVPVVDLWAWRDAASAAGELLLALEQGPLPVLRPSEVHSEVLVIGGGVGGCEAALDLAKAGHKVYLLDESLSIGGIMAKLDKTFPTLDCSICILGPKLVEVATHPNIEMLTNAVVTRITGGPGDFRVEVTLKPRYVDMTKCVGCGSCGEVCPVILPSSWNLGMKPRKCIRIVFAQAVPLRATLEKDYCIDCRQCATACGRQAINLDDAPRTVPLQVGAVILATGATPFDPKIKGEYGYGVLPPVITNLEFERLVCATGPTSGRLVTPEGRPVRRLAFIQCVGSRDRRFLPYCSGYCCTASIKEAMLALEHNPEIEVTIFYNDIRTSGKGFEELYLRAQAAGVRFFKALPGSITLAQEGQPVIAYEDLATGRQERLTVDLAVLAVGLEGPKTPPPFLDQILERDEQGFFKARHPIMHPVEASLPGVCLAGTCLGPQDIAETVCQASGAAGRVLRLLAELRHR